MNNFAQILQPADEYIPGILSGRLTLNTPANRIVDADSKKFVAGLVPGDDVQQALARLPLNPTQAAASLDTTPELSALAPILHHMRVISTIGALASVANVAVSCVGFAFVLHRLSRIDGRLDDVIEARYPPRIGARAARAR